MNTYESCSFKEQKIAVIIIFVGYAKEIVNRKVYVTLF